MRPRGARPTGDDQPEVPVGERLGGGGEQLREGSRTTAAGAAGALSARPRRPRPAAPAVRRPARSPAPR
ncbi:hypothetical protein SSAG_05772 [Streptomyces sp. Mg1]|nr:hypothetical protein SSAG_05772 [Streptomyces sp. Mg1]